MDDVDDGNGNDDPKDAQDDPMIATCRPTTVTPPAHSLALCGPWSTLRAMADAPAPADDPLPYGVPAAWHADRDRVARVDGRIDRWVAGELDAMAVVARGLGVVA